MSLLLNNLLGIRLKHLTSLCLFWARDQLRPVVKKMIALWSVRFRNSWNKSRLGSRDRLQKYLLQSLGSQPHRLRGRKRKSVDRKDLKERMKKSATIRILFWAKNYKSTIQKNLKHPVMAGNCTRNRNSTTNPLENTWTNLLLRTIPRIKSLYALIYPIYLTLFRYSAFTIQKPKRWRRLQFT